MKWIEEKGKDEDIVVSTRLRLARNLEKYKFPDLIEEDEVESLENDLLSIMKENIDTKAYEFHRIKDLNNIEKDVFVEEHLISPNLSRKADEGSFFVRQDEKVTIMVNEEDHIRIQVLLSGLNFEEGYKLSSEIDNYLDDKIEYAFHDQYGYLTSCPTNVGTGLRASVMLHLPCITMTGHINSIMLAISKLGLTVRGLYGEGSKVYGHLFQISNQVTLGESEEDIIKKLNKVVRQIISRERSYRAYMMDYNIITLKDRIFRSLGILKYSRIISSSESMNHLSNIKLGIDLGLIWGMESKSILKIMMAIQPANIQKHHKDQLTQEERHVMRADFLRENLSCLEV